jgi:hypothetical protein
MVRTKDANKESIGWVHKKVHEQVNYFVKKRFKMEIEDSILDLLLISRDSPNLAHAVFLIKPTTEILVDFYQDAEVSENGIGYENENSDRNAPRLPLPFRYSVFKGPTIQNLGHHFYEGFADEDHPIGNLASGRDIEFIAKRNSNYILRITKENVSKGAWIDFTLSYYLQEKGDGIT